MLHSFLRPAMLLGSALLTLALVACSSDSPTPVGGDATSVVATDLAFQPKELRVPLNQPQKVRFENKGKLLHDWTVEKIAVTGVKESGSAAHGMDTHSASPGAGMGGMMGGASAPNANDASLHVAAGPGASAMIEFTATEAGTYVFYCTVSGHREAGMEGKLTVR